ncbi:Ammonium transporter Rh type B [Porphyridium purpureum]|uniref:Ammonium transporter Rh type B n=1 Tax=Porphyridium purpureum TaxID=35688 RepID=A0A5J4Z3R3_PORPP|nr:Ammonium transporter Rh type B [Porphyridium purpureum]|eukprot:POR1922..scf208_2
MAEETTRLMPSSTGQRDFAHVAAPTLTTLIGAVQAILLLLFLGGSTYSRDDYSPAEYIIFRDIMVMLLLGFGFLMTFLKKYGLGAVGLTLLLSVLAIQMNVFAELGARFVHSLFTGVQEEDAVLPLPIGMSTMIDGEFAAATLLISYGAVLGRASPVQLVIMAIGQAVFYAINKAVFVLGILGAEDVGGSMTIHLFGALFGLAASFALGAPRHASSSSNAQPSAVSDVFALIGTTLLWVFWPSFVSATESAVPAYTSRCVLHTVLALLGSTAAAFYMSVKKCHGKLDPVHLANSTLAGGVAVGSSARLGMTPGGALALGVLAGVVSVYGYVYLTPKLEKSCHVYDTCGVGNLHGLPGMLGGLGSVVFVVLDPHAPFLQYGVVAQCARQILAVACTVAIAIGSGLLTGLVMAKSTGGKDADFEPYDDAVWFEGPYFEVEAQHAKV